ncbi:hypothetical protein JOE63_002938 [Cellulosimicrobium cellulans]|uniref:hypothetical protein n=1 Tax=Cellulosimicrobium cellulans TaxID=1710 RepID=UPI001957B290|nr:hypothetical protein [Cellulosimicrobium cellulans]MBM7820461.1 hypothetical protein [Cellulosimicrobium cellulans]
MTRRKNPATTVRELRRLMDATYKMRGIVRCREAIDLVRPGTDSSMETRTRLLLVQAGLPCPQVNVPAHDDGGQFLALPDLSYPELRIAIEYDGDVHRTDPATWRRERGAAAAPRGRRLDHRHRDGRRRAPLPRAPGAPGPGGEGPPSGTRSPAECMK